VRSSSTDRDLLSTRPKQAPLLPPRRSPTPRLARLLSSRSHEPPQSAARGSARAIRASRHGARTPDLGRVAHTASVAFPTSMSVPYLRRSGRAELRVLTIAQHPTSVETRSRDHGRGKEDRMERGRDPHALTSSWAAGGSALIAALLNRLRWVDAWRQSYRPALRAVRFVKIAAEAAMPDRSAYLTEENPSPRSQPHFGSRPRSAPPSRALHVTAPIPSPSTTMAATCTGASAGRDSRRRHHPRRSYRLAKKRGSGL